MLKIHINNYNGSNISKMSKPTICLNMIVKNESHVITEALECASKYINYYVINDTGSTDNTIELIKTFFDEKGIKGEIISHEFRTCSCHTGIYKKYPKWFHFGWNRTYAMQKCVGKSDYIWIIDADDLIVGEMDFSNLTKDMYMVTIGKGFTYPRAQIFKNDASYNWRYVGGLHEYPTCDKKDQTKGKMEGFYLDSRRLGDRSKDNNKYANDAEFLEALLEDNPNNERDTFYCGQSYFDAKDYENALRMYKIRVSQNGWFEETYFAYYKIATCLEVMMNIGATYTWVDVEKAYLDAYNYCKSHSEPLYHIAKHYREKGDYVNGYKYAKKAAVIPFPKHEILFAFKNIYDYKAKDELAICAYGINNFYESYNYCRTMLNSGLVEHGDIQRIKNHMLLSEKKLNEKNKKSCCIYVGNEILNDKQKYIIDGISKGYNVTLVGNNVVYNDLPIINSSSMAFINKTKFNYLIIWDFINYFYDKINIQNEHTILLLSDEYIKLKLDNNIYVSIHNNTYLNNYMSKVNTIVLLKDKIKTNFVKIYGIDENKLYSLNGECHNLFVEDKHKYVFDVDMDGGYNGLKYHEPNYKNIMTNYDYGCEYVESTYENIIKKFNMPEHYVNLANILYENGKFNNASFKLDKALAIKGYKSYEPIIKLYKNRCLIKIEKYEEAYENINNILQNNVMPNDVREMFEDIRDDTIMYFKDKTLIYNQRKIKTIVNEKNNNIVFSMTTCKRYDLFEKTINSFINCCNDLHLIGHWLCVDDNSSEEDRKKMKKNYPFFKFIFKDETQKGHYISMNIIRDYVLNIGANYVLHCEDDFHYFQKRNYIGDSLKIFNDNNKIGQVLFNRNYAEADFSQRKIKGGFNKVLGDGMRYVIHEHYDTDTKEYNEFVKRCNGYGHCGYWEGFSFRPSLVNTNIFKDIGSFYNTDHFERAYAVEYKLKGYLSAFFDTYCCIHIGKKTWEKTANSYTLNNMGQFSLNKDKLSINVLSNNVDTFKTFRDTNGNQLPQFNKCDMKKIIGLNDYEKKILLENDFNYLRPIINKIFYHLRMFINNKSEFMIFFKDNILLNNNFNKTFDNLTKYKFDLMIFENKIGEGNGVSICNDMVNFNNYDAYMISKSGMNKIIDHINNHGIKNENYLNNIQNFKTLKYDNLCSYDKIVDEYIDIDNLYTKYDNYKFYCLMDSMGNDLSYVGKKSVDELKEECDKLGGIAFNTLGWIKHSVTMESQFINLPCDGETHMGLYVKI